MSDATTIPGRDAPPRMQDYAAERARFRVDVPAVFNPVVDLLETWAAERPDDLALLSLGPNGETVAEQSVADLVREARRFGSALQALGVRKGDPVFVMLPRVPAWYTAVLGAIRIGAVPMPGPNLLTPKDIAYRVTRADAVVAITDAAGAAKIDAIDEPLPSLRTRIAWLPDADPASGAATPAVPGPALAAATAVPAAPAGWEDLGALLAAAPDDGSDLPAQPTRREDPLLLYFTSGTVSQPKMVLHTQEYGLGHVATARFWHDLRPGDRHWTVTDTGWAKAAWGGLFGQWHERATVVQVALGRPDAHTILRILREHRITSFCAPPTLYRALVQADLAAHDLSTLRHCTSAGEPLNPEVIKVWAEGTGGLTVHDAYGQTETTVLVANYPGVPVRPGSMGLPVPGWDVDVLAEDGSRAPDGEVGSIAVRVDEDHRPVGLFAGYHRDPEATADRFRNGWYLTGDKAARDTDGYLWFEGRDDDVITSSAYRIGPFEVESVLVEHPAVMEAAVVGKDDPERTQIVTAFVILAAGFVASDALAKELQDHTKQLTAPYKYPREIHFVTELPKTVSGKIRRTELRDLLRQG
ncbi:acyl-CoA synthetase [Patulibacter americanus]|uniref:acyl-CoA synthetase n=1 Tax=Patulibacter americanus TaxID=588672 RepID=UPI0003B3255C|nr:AMP-binding protein [Patulibacter americanus]